MANQQVISEVRKFLKPYLLSLGVKFKGQSFSCPFHDDKTPSAIIYTSGLQYRCYSCGRHGDIIDLYQEVESKTFTTALIEVANAYGVPIDPSKFKTFHNTKDDDPIKTILQATAMLLKENQNRDFLRERSITTLEAKQNNIGTIGNQKLRDTLTAKLYTQDQLVKAGICYTKHEQGQNTFRISPAFGDSRLTFTLKDMNGSVVGFAGRDMYYKKNESQGAKYYNTAQTQYFTKSKVLYNLDIAAQHAKKSSNIMIVEGYTDVIAVRRTGIHNVVGICGTALTADHVGILNDLGINFVNMCLDSDKAGIESCINYIEMYFTNSSIKAVFTLLPSGEDPDSYMKKHGRAAFLRLVPISTPEFLIQYSPELNQLTREQRIKKQCDIAANYLELGDGISARIFAHTIAVSNNIEDHVIIKEMAKNEIIKAKVPPG